MDQRLQLILVAEGVGFEPTFRFRKTVFKTAALNHSAIPPYAIGIHRTIHVLYYQFRGYPSRDTSGKRCRATL